MSDRPIEPQSVVDRVEMFVTRELLDSEEYDNRTPLDGSGVYALHQLAGEVYAEGWRAGALAAELTHNFARTRARDLERERSKKSMDLGPGQIFALPDAKEVELEVLDEPHPTGTTLTVSDSPKMLGETLSVAQSGIPTGERQREHIDRLQRLLDECRRHRPTGAGGKHDNRHTPTCGCQSGERREFVVVSETLDYSKALLEDMHALIARMAGHAQVEIGEHRTHAGVATLRLELTLPVEPRRYDA